MRKIQKGVEPQQFSAWKAMESDARLFVSPLMADCQPRFLFMANGHIQATNEHDKAAIVTIRKLGLERLRFTIYLADPLPLTPEQSRKVPKNLASPARAQSGAQSGAQSEKILFALSDAPLSATELMNLLSMETKTGAFKRAIKELLDAGVIEYTLPEKPSSRLQKYRRVKK